MAEAASLWGQARHAFETGNLGEARQRGLELLATQPENSEIPMLLGMVAAAEGNWQQASEWLNRATCLQPPLPEAFRALAHAEEQLHHYARAITCLENYAAAVGGSPESLFGLGNLYARMRDYPRAIDWFTRTLALNPNSSATWINLGAAYRRINELDAALNAYDRAIELKPDSPVAHKDRGYVYFLMGRWKDGWREHENRPMAVRPSPYPQPVWQGQPIPGQTLFVRAEQGLGDAIQFVRYVKLARARAGKVVLQCLPQQKRLFEYSGVAEQVIALRKESVPAFDYQILIMSLPAVMEEYGARIPNETPYLKAPATHALPQTGRPRVGLAWRGNRSHRLDGLRSMNLRELIPALKAGGIDFYALQLPLPEADRDCLRTLAGVTNLEDRLTDYLATASYVQQMNLLLTVDTSIAHLAGALGIPTWTMLPFSPDWRWELAGEKTPWYPTMRLFRQRQAGNWPEVVEQVVQELKAHLPARA